MCLSERSINELTTDTLRSTPVRQIISELRSCGTTGRDRFKLSREIEILAIVTSMIDMQSPR